MKGRVEYLAHTNWELAWNYDNEGSSKTDLFSPYTRG